MGFVTVTGWWSGFDDDGRVVRWEETSDIIVSAISPSKSV